MSEGERGGGAREGTKLDRGGAGNEIEGRGGGVDVVGERMGKCENKMLAISTELV